MSKVVAFIDETGVLGPSSQRFYGLGLMKLEDAAPLTEAVHRTYQRVRGRLGKASVGFEFKFNTVKRVGLPYHLQLIDEVFAHPPSRFLAMMLDKHDLVAAAEEEAGSAWDSYIDYSRALVQNSRAAGESVCVLADYQGKPRASGRYYEHEILALANDPTSPGTIFNVCMLESHASLLIQVVDVLLGAVSYDFLRLREPAKGTDPCKVALADRLREHLGTDSLAFSAHQREASWFDVREVGAKD